MRWLAGFALLVALGCSEEPELVEPPAPCADADADGVCDDDDVCALGDDARDADRDGVPDDCDVCANGDDALDADADGVADACDRCAGQDDALDADGDGIPDGCDLCEGVVDGPDTDGDEVPDGCDPCPADAPDDANGDLVCDSDPAFDIAYISLWTYENGQWNTNSTGVVVNTGLVPLDLDTLEVMWRGDSSTSSDGSVGFTASGRLPPGQHAGTLSALARSMILTDGWVTEPLGKGGFSMDVGVDAATDPLLFVDTVVRIDGVDIVLKHRFDFLPKFASIVSFDGVNRVSSERTL